MTIFGSLNFQVIYAGYNQPQTLEYIVTGLTTGQTYSFTLAALNFNGQSSDSAVFDFNACEVPSSFAAPFYISSTVADRKSVV